MKKILLILTFLLALIAANACNSEEFVVIDNGNEKIKVNVEIADTSEERAAGLMSRESLDENSGMLFVYQWEDYYSFWMKNTLIPLDIIWVSGDGEIADIKHAEPCTEDPCTSYKPVKPAKYVLEVNGNFTIKNSVSIGDIIAINLN
ncbi:DUF192 domain-containing protein [Candidatus Woesearchaeota archaeon]|nr:DUF192 domain-containing protein [Candidatus Woesearchaeota archaeon]